MERQWGVIRRSGNYIPYSLSWALLFSDKLITNFVYTKDEAQEIAKAIASSKKRQKYQ